MARHKKSIVIGLTPSKHGLFFDEHDPRRVWKQIHEYRQRDLSYWGVVGFFSLRLRSQIATHGPISGLAMLLRRRLVPFGRTALRQPEPGVKIASVFLQVLDHFPELQQVPVIVTDMSPRAGYTGLTDGLRSLAKDRPNIIPVDVPYTPADFFRFDLHLNARGQRKVAARLDATLKDVFSTRKPVIGAAALHAGY